MIDSSPYGEDFQFRLLTYLLKDPEKMFDIVEPQFFFSPVLVEISRILKENYAAHGKQVRVSRSTLIELVRATMGEQDSWFLYKRTIKKLYKTHLGDKAILYKQSFEFSKEAQYRETLIAAERDVTNKNYHRVHERFDKLLTPLNGTGDGSLTWDNVPRFDLLPVPGGKTKRNHILLAVSVLLA